MGFRIFPKDIRQWKVVLIAFAVATTFWFFNSLNKDYTTSLDHPVTFVYNQDSLISVRKLPAKIGLDVTGGGWSLLRHESIFNPTPIQIDLSNPVGVSHLSWLEILPSIREQMGDLSVNQILQDTLRIQIEPIIEKTVQVWIDSTKLEMEEDFRLISPIRIDKREVTLRGPKSFIDTLDARYQIHFSEDEIDENFSGDIIVDVPRNEIISSNPPTILAAFEVDRFDRLQIDIPIEPSNFPPDSSVYLASGLVTVDFIVQRSLQREYSAQDFIVVSDFDQINEGDSTASVMLLQFPEEAVSVRLREKSVPLSRNE